jgi:predicted tellurium resistance membrane protein TerC
VVPAGDGRLDKDGRLLVCAADGAIATVDWITSGEIWVALLTLTALEIVLGIDNVIFISILADRLPPNQRDRARLIGLSLAMGMRILLLLSINWIANLTEPLFSVLEHEVSGRDLILLGGGLFLIAKSTTEIHSKLEGHDEHGSAGRAAATFASVLIQILLLDIVFSLDSVITAVGMADDIGVMIAAVVIAVGVMLFASGPISAFVSQHPTVKMLALSFLLLIGVSLVAEGWHTHIPKGYIYSAMAFSVLVEMLNLRLRARSEPVQLHEPRINQDAAQLAERVATGAGRS